jgi:hypothetical protein
MILTILMVPAIVALILFLLPYIVPLFLTGLTLVITSIVIFF